MRAPRVIARLAGVESLARNIGNDIVTGLGMPGGSFLTDVG
jgi:hypothetical protein